MFYSSVCCLLSDPFPLLMATHIFLIPHPKDRSVSHSPLNPWPSTVFESESEPHKYRLNTWMNRNQWTSGRINIFHTEDYLQVTKTGGRPVLLLASQNCSSTLVPEWSTQITWLAPHLAGLPEPPRCLWQRLQSPSHGSQAFRGVPAYYIVLPLTSAS